MASSQEPLTTGKAVLDRNPDKFLSRSVHDLISLKGRTIVITGGGRGLGLAFGFAVAEVGGNVAVIDLLDKPHDHFQKLATEFNVKVKLYKSDVTNYGHLQATFDEIVKDFGRIDGLVTAAGICPDEPFLNREPESVARCMNINVLGTYYAAQLAARQMAKQEPAEFNPRGGSIVLIASIAAHVASKGQTTSDYCASKGAVVSLAKALGVELAAVGIRVNSISPGPSPAPCFMIACFVLPQANDDTAAGGIDIMVNEPPMRRIGDRTDLKVPVVYLLSDAGAYHTSDDLLITGGIHAGRLM
ncbi:NAD(P)-binding protein [Coniochaeta ligniaria NRRL 30616]|uniref:NAD(P)-binding protein n=1 Tax=Coniochaeta ligniaria NRRL 30616 TaxID=1408157 RepID=A0A1J7IXW2_9PEZI|nr:NAD(P)-binding protein [Coniochaeta ligniaria NRRL 30616]